MRGADGDGDAIYTQVMVAFLADGVFSLILWCFWQMSFFAYVFNEFRT